MPIGPLADMQYLSKFRSLSSPDLFAGACGNEMKRHINWSCTNYDQAFCWSKDPTTNNRYNWWTPFGSGKAMKFLSLISIFCWLHALFRQRVLLQARRSSGGPRRMPKKGALGICASTVLLSRGCDPKNPFALPESFTKALCMSQSSFTWQLRERQHLQQSHETVVAACFENIHCIRKQSSRLFTKKSWNNR